MTTWTQIKAWRETMKASNSPQKPGFIKALTVCQPYAEEIARCAKRVENRTWYTHYRGPLLIHAGKSRAWLNGDTDEDLKEDYGRALEFGAIVAITEVVDCLRADYIAQGKAEEKYPSLFLPSHRQHVNGPWCFVLANTARFKTPFPYRGAQGFFDVPESFFPDSSDSGEAGT